MANFNRILKPKANLGHNGFDLSTNQVFSTKVGLLNVPYVTDTVPNSMYDIDINSLVRTQTLNKPAFLRLKGFLHFYFVPYRVLWHQWDNFYTQRVENHSSYTQSHTACPNVNVNGLVQDLINHFYDPTQVPTGIIWTDKQGYDVSDNVIRMLDMLGYGNYTEHFRALDAQTVDQNTPHYNPNIFRILAYNKIWYDYHRNPFWANDMSPKAYNADYLPCLDVQSACCNAYNATHAINLQETLNLFQPKYVRWKSDLFMGALPNQQFGGATTLNANNVYIHNLKGSGTSSYRTGMDSNMNLVIKNNSDAVATGTDHWSINDLFDVLELRKAEALQNWKERTLRAGNKAYDQYKAHFGVEPSDLQAEHSEYIGGYSFNVGVDEVTNLAEGAAKLGDLGAKGYGVGSHHIKFKAEEFGVLMATLYFIPENVYGSNCIEPQVTMVEPFDFYTPEFMNVGLQGIPRYLLTFDMSSTAQDPAEIVGYSSRYFQYKTAMDRAHGLFDPVGANSLTSFVATRRDLQASTFQYLTDGHLYVNPNIMDNIFGVQADFRQNTDQLYCNFNFDIKAVLPMSVVGLPNNM